MTIRCTNCNKPLKPTIHFAGRKGKCPECGTKHVLPSNPSGEPVRMTAGRPGLFVRMRLGIIRTRLRNAVRSYREGDEGTVALLRENRAVAVDMLMRDLRDPSQGLIYRMHIPLLLAKLGGLQAADTCLAIIRDTAIDKAVRQNAVRAAGEMGLTGDQPFIDALLACVRERAGFVEHPAALLLCRTRRPEVTAPVAEYLFVCPASRRGEVEGALAGLDPAWWTTAAAKTVVPALMTAFRDGNAEQRRYLADHMGRIADARFAPVLRQAAENGDAQLRPAAAVALRAVAAQHGLHEHLAWLDTPVPTHGRSHKPQA
jgi:DNA-directed RNA polymerase subunit RPC12/RpoP